MEKERVKHAFLPDDFPPPTGKSRVQGIFCLLGLFFTAYFGTIVLLFPAVLFLPFSIKLYRTWIDFFSALWFKTPILFVEFLFGTKIVITGDDTLTSNGGAVVIANHRTRLDWLFLWSFFLRRGNLENEKIILKGDVKSIPGFGWAMQHFCFLFLSRKWEVDEKTISSIFDYFSGYHYPVQLLLFPEGTDLTPNTSTRGAEWAAKQTPPLPPVEFLLHPRVKGFQHAIQRLRSTVNDVYDITIGYPDLIPQNIKTLALGIAPREIHYHVTRYPIKDIPNEENKLAAWLEKRWSEKEQNLKKFYEETKSFKFLPSDPKATNRGVTVPLYLALAFWVSFLSITFYALFTTSWFFWYVVFATIFYVVVTKVYNGLEFIELKFAAREAGVKKQ